jgi:hypothetical protein
MYQWSNFLFFPEGVGAVSWSEVIDNQFRVVPVQAFHGVVSKFAGFMPAPSAAEQETRDLARSVPR